MKSIRLLLSVCIALITLAHSQETRIWTYAKTGSTCEGVLQWKSQDGTEVQIKRKDNGLVLTMKAEMLIEGDQKAIKQWSSRDDRLAAELDEEFQIGRSLSAQQARELEANLADLKDSLRVRVRLISYYTSLRPRTTESAVIRSNHIYWLIENTSEVPMQFVTFNMLSLVDRPFYEKAKDLWLKQIESHPKNSTVLGNAAVFFQVSDLHLTEDCLLKAVGLEPENLKWWERLGHHYDLASINDPQQAAKSLSAFEKAQSLDNDADSRFSRMPSLAKQAYAAGETAKAQRYALLLLETSAKFPKSRNYGNAIFHGNTVLGRIALKNGDTEKAKYYLLKAGSTSGSPQLNSFGPNMSLAKELFDKGEKEVVLEFFTLIEKFWKSGPLQLAEWRKQIAAGDAPKMDGQLSY